MKLVIIRHGETEMNKEERLQGSRNKDIPLNDEGRKEVARLRDELLIFPQKIYTSPLIRAKQTALIINERFNVPLIEDPLLVERDFGTLSGKQKSEVDQNILNADLEERYDYHPFGGEDVGDVRKRVMQFLAQLNLENDETNFIVTHRGIIRLFYDVFPLSATSSEVINASKHIFEIKKLPAESR